MSGPRRLAPLPTRKTRPACVLALAFTTATLALACSLPSAGGAVTDGSSAAARHVRAWKIHYRAHNGDRRDAYVLLPAGYGPRHHPPIPLVISPHGRGVTARANARLWGNLPARGGFAVVNPEGQGRRLQKQSWGSFGQVQDLARMPDIVRKQLPWLRIDPGRIYAFGGSMGGQESLLLLARYPTRLAGVAVFDAVTDFALQYRRFPFTACNKRCLQAHKKPIGYDLRRLAREEVGGTPKTKQASYAMRSPINYARTIASACVPLQVWWSVSDRIVTEQQRQSGRFFWKLRGIDPETPVLGFVGFWIHSSSMRARTGLPLALATFGLLPESADTFWPSVRRIKPLPRHGACAEVPQDPLAPGLPEPPATPPVAETPLPPEPEPVSPPLEAPAPPATEPVPPPAGA